MFFMASKGRQQKRCEWCDKPIHGWYLSYKKRYFCMDKDNACLKNFLLREADEYIKMDYQYTEEDFKDDAEGKTDG